MIALLPILTFLPRLTASCVTNESSLWTNIICCWALRVDTESSKYWEAKWFVKWYSSLYTFFYIHEKKVLESWKFSTSGFRWIYMFWDVLNKIWRILENICLSVCMSPKFCGYCISNLMRRNWWNTVFSCTLI